MVVSAALVWCALAVWGSGVQPAPDTSGAPSNSRTVRSAYADLDLLPLEASADGIVTLQLHVRPDAGLHIYAANRRGFIGPVLTPSSRRVRIVGAAAPPPERLDGVTASGGTPVYRAPFTLRYQLRAPGVRRVKATFRYQACTNEVCFKPESIVLEWTAAFPRSSEK